MNRISPAAILVLLATAFAPAFAALPPRAPVSVTNAAAVTEARVFRTPALALPYRLHAPKAVTPGARYPLVLFLHGAGERGTDNAMQLVHGVWPILGYMRAHAIEGYLVAPQCPNGCQWVDTPWSLQDHRMNPQPSRPMAAAMALLDECLANLPVDRTRVYVTGISMGGYGTWDIVQRRPALFAAAIPVCGGGDAHLAWTIRDVPIWAFHGDRDTTVPFARSRAMVAALWQCDGNIRYREYPGVGHGCWGPTYDDPTVLAWFFAQRKR